LLAVLIAVGSPAAGFDGARSLPSPAWAASCHDRGVEVDLAGSGDVGVVSGHSVNCPAGSRGVPRSPPAPFYADEIMCPPGRTGPPQGLCAATPCPGAGLLFALRTLHDPDGQQRAAGSACMTLRRARIGPGISAAEVLAAVRAVKLPGGRIRASPGGRGLANVAAYFRLDGVSARTADLALRGSTIHAEFQTTEYRWTFGDGFAWTSVATGLPNSLASAHAYPRRGRFEVVVEVAWSAEAFLDGRRVGRLDDLVSHARISYPVAEIRAGLSS